MNGRKVWSLTVVALLMGGTLLGGAPLLGGCRGSAFAGVVTGDVAWGEDEAAPLIGAPRSREGGATEPTLRPRHVAALGSLDDEQLRDPDTLGALLGQRRLEEASVAVRLCCADLAPSVTAALATDDWRSLRALAHERLSSPALAAGRADDHEAAQARLLARLHAVAILQDDEIVQPVAEPLDALDAWSTAVVLNAGSSVLFRLRDTDGGLWVFKPEQSIRHTNYRGEIASWRVAELLELNLHVPESREVVVRESWWEALTGRHDVAHTRSRLSVPTWTTGDDGERRLHGMLKPWVDGMARFPIERTGSWSPWLSGERPLDEIRTRSALELMAGFTPDSEEQRTRYTRALQGVPAMELLHQLSDLHVFDYLTNNWDRYQPERFGLNCHVRAGRVVALDNGATFLPAAAFSDRSTAWRLRRIRHFSASTVAHLRALDTELARDILFPGNRPDEREAFDAMLERRDAMLAHVDRLIARHGEEAVLTFP
mgnify:CR=1 FL=1